QSGSLGHRARLHGDELLLRAAQRHLWDGCKTMVLANERLHVTISPMTDDETDEQFYRDTESIAFPKLDDSQLAMLEPLGSRRKVQRGELIFKAGQRDLPPIALL